MKNRIGQIIAFCALALVVVAVVLCAVIKIDYMPQMKLPQYPEVIQITDTEAGAISKAITDDDFNTFTTKFNDSFKFSVIYSIFSGKIGKSIGSPKKVTKGVSTISKTGDYKVMFMFNEEQVLKDKGKDVTLAINSNEKVTFNRVMFFVQAEKGLSGKILVQLVEGRSRSAAPAYRYTSAYFHRLIKMRTVKQSVK